MPRLDRFGGNATGSTQGITYYTMWGQQYARAKPVQVNDADSPAQRAQRAKLKGLGGYSQQLKGLTEITLRAIAYNKKQYHNNIFVSENKDIINTSTGSFDPSKVKDLYVSSGSLELLKNPQASPGAGGNIGVLIEATGYLPTTDLTTPVYWCVWNETANYCYWGNPNSTIQDGGFQISNVGATGDKVHVFVCAFNNATKRGTNTQYLGVHTLTA